MKILKTTIYSLLIGSLVACGGAESKQKNKSAEKPKQEKKAEPKTEKVETKKAKEIVEITLIAKGESMAEIAFDPKTLTVPANSRVKLTLKNESSAAGMLHNFVLVELGSGQEIAQAGIKAGKDNEFVPNDSRVFANTKMTKMGETVVIEFDAPAKGSYHYICTYPGHYPNMIGRFNVQ